MCTLYERIQVLCKNRGVSGSRMCLDLGLSKSTLSDIKSGRKKGVSVQTAQKIAGYFNITVDELYGKYEEKEKPTENGGLPNSVAELIDVVKTLSEEDAASLLAALKAKPKQ